MEHLRVMCGEKAVSFKVEWSEGEDMWYGDITSSARSEEREFKRFKVLDDLLNAMRQHVEGL